MSVVPVVLAHPPPSQFLRNVVDVSVTVPTEPDLENYSLEDSDIRWPYPHPRPVEDVERQPSLPRPSGLGHIPDSWELVDPAADDYKFMARLINHQEPMKIIHFWRLPRGPRNLAGSCSTPRSDIGRLVGFHGTRLDFMPSIAAKGFMVPEIGGMLGRCVYLAPKWTKAAGFAKLRENRKGENSILVCHFNPVGIEIWPSGKTAQTVAEYWSQKTYGTLKATFTKSPEYGIRGPCQIETAFVITFVPQPKMRPKKCVWVTLWLVICCLVIIYVLAHFLSNPAYFPEFYKEFSHRAACVAADSLRRIKLDPLDQGVQLCNFNASAPLSKLRQRKVWGAVPTYDSEPGGCKVMIYPSTCLSKWGAEQRNFLSSMCRENVKSGFLGHANDSCTDYREVFPCQIRQGFHTEPLEAWHSDYLPLGPLLTLALLVATLGIAGIIGLLCILKKC